MFINIRSVQAENAGWLAGWMAAVIYSLRIPFKNKMRFACLLSIVIIGRWIWEFMNAIFG